MSKIVETILTLIKPANVPTLSAKELSILNGSINLIMRYDVEKNRSFHMSTTLINLINKNNALSSFKGLILNGIISEKTVKKLNQTFKEKKIPEEIQKHHVYPMRHLREAVLSANLSNGILIKSELVNFPSGHLYPDETVSTLCQILDLQNVMEAVLKSEHYQQKP